MNFLGIRTVDILMFVWYSSARTAHSPTRIPSILLLLEESHDSSVSLLYIDGGTEKKFQRKYNLHQHLYACVISWSKSMTLLIVFQVIVAIFTQLKKNIVCVLIGTVESVRIIQHKKKYGIKQSHKRRANLSYVKLVRFFVLWLGFFLELWLVL